MISRVIADLQRIEDTTAEKLVAIFSGTETKVEDSFYASTVFESQEKYNELKGYISGQVVGSVSKKMIETPLVFVRGKEQPVFCSYPTQGIAFGFTLVDYRSSKPLVVATVDNVGAEYEYKSVKWDSVTNTYTESEFSSMVCEDFKTLIDMVLENLNNDVDKWKNKY